MASNSVILPVTLPVSSVKPLDTNGNFTLQWRLYFQALGKNTSNSSVNLSILQSEIATATAIADEALAGVTTAQTDATAALTLAESLEFSIPLIYANDENIISPSFSQNYEDSSVTIINNLTISEDTINKDNNNALIFAALDQGSLIR